MWRFWTPGWGPRGWWQWFKADGLPWWIAWKLPRKIALLAFVRVCSATCQAPDDITYESAYKAWESGIGK